MARFSRTVNPLHFEDLEPHRFEDLVRQLTYDFRVWHSIEATGRLGADEGVDIRAVERVPLIDLASSLPEDEEAHSSSYEQRLWLIQCKRERRVGPEDMKGILAAAIKELTPIPYGFIVAAPCDFSSRTRGVFRVEANKLGINEFFVWGKAELEDMLFLPKNDHLLFAYFGLSLQLRRRSEKSTFTSRLSVKRKLVKVFESLTGQAFQTVLLRDSTATEYPRPSSSIIFGKNDRWRYFRFGGLIGRPDHIALIVHEYWAWAKFDTKEWDMISNFDQAWPLHPKVFGVPEHFPAKSDEEEAARRYWHCRVPKKEQAHYRVYGFIHYDRILLIDDLGDACHEPPHLIIDCGSGHGFFDDFRVAVEGDHRWSEQHFFPEDSKRTALFPKVMPKISDEEFYSA